MYVYKGYFQIYVNYTGTEKDGKNKHSNVNSNYCPNGGKMGEFNFHMCILLYIFPIFYNAYHFAFIFRKINKKHYFLK